MGTIADDFMWNNRTVEAIRFKHPALALLLGSFCLLTIFGNCLVVVAVVTKKYLHTPTGYLIVSLAAADLLVGCVVMPLNVVFEITSHVWLLGSTMCDTWRSIDVLASTASIWNLCVISLDRYLANRDPLGYPDRVSIPRISLAIVAIWLLSAFLSFPAIAWWHHSSPQLYLDPHQCEFTDDAYYVVFSSMVSFYIPLCVILFAYWRVFVIASNHQKFLKTGSKHIKTNKSAVSEETPEPSACLRVHRGGSALSTKPKTPPTKRQESRSLIIRPRRRSSASALEDIKPGDKYRGPTKEKKASLSISVHETHLMVPPSPVVTPCPSPLPGHKFKQALSLRLSRSANSLQSSIRGSVDREREKSNSTTTTLLACTEVSSSASENQTQIVRLKKGVAQKSKLLVKYVKEKRAARTLSIVVGCFVACWLPFFVINILLVLCPHCVPNVKLVFTVLTWLGHCNSALNPLIYSRFSREFRRAFKQILCRKKQRQGARAGLESVLRVVAIGMYKRQKSNTDSNSDEEN